MDIHFFDHDDAPVPPEEVRIREIRAEPHPDGRRVRVYLELTPFQRRPNAEIDVRNPDGQIVSTLSVIETIDARMEFTMHLRGPQPAGEYRLEARIYYSELVPDHPPEEGENNSEPVDQTVHQKAIFFSIEL